jgi:hypothetical protein
VTLLRAVAGATLAAALLTGPGCGPGEPGTGPTAAEILEGEPRVAELLAPCDESGFYDRDLSDMAAVLTRKLERSRPDPLKRAKEELGQLGEDAFPELERFFQRNYGDRMYTPLLENAIDALAFNHTETSHRLLLEAAQHPQESVRRKAYESLARHGRAGDFDFLLERLPLELEDTRTQLVPVLFQLDPARAGRLALDWIERDEMPGQRRVVTPLLAATRAPEVAAACAGLFASQELPASTHLAAAAARSGDEAAIAFLRGELQSEGAQRRLTAVHAAAQAGLVDLLEYSVFQEEEANTRAIAVATLGQLEAPSGQHVAWLRSALGDPSPVVQGEALTALCRHGDAEGLARAMAQLREDGVLLTQALQALREPLGRDPKLARTALDLLLERNELESDRPLIKRSSTLKAIGQVPLPEAAEFLHRLGVEAGQETLEGLRAHDWLMIQAANTGLPGRQRLLELLGTEADPLLRIDLIDAVAAERDDLARPALLSLVEDETREPLERLFVAGAAMRCGPSWVVAPRLKRVVYALQDPEVLRVRQALQCQLWFWY